MLAILHYVNDLECVINRILIIILIIITIITTYIGLTQTTILSHPTA